MKITVIVPVYEQWNIIGELITSLENQDFPEGEWECLIVDNGSKVNITDQSLTSPSFIRVLECYKPGSYAARNKAIREARGELLVFTDADCIPRYNWLTKYWAIFQNYGNRFIYAGGIDVKKIGTKKPKTPELYDMVLGLPQERYVKNGIAVTANLAVPFRVFKEIGGFRDDKFSGGDILFCKKASSIGYTIKYEEDAKVIHPARDSYEEFRIKFQRIKGAAYPSSSNISAKLYFILSSLIPPARSYKKIITSSKISAYQKLLILTFSTRLWAAGLIETISLFFGKKPERR